MRREKTRLTGAQIRYLLVLERLNCPEGIRVSDIATAMKVSKPSVHNMMDTFMAEASEACMEALEREEN